MLPEPHTRSPIPHRSISAPLALVGPWHPPVTSLTAWSTPQGWDVPSASGASGAGNRRAITNVLLHPVIFLCIWSILGFAGGLVCALSWLTAHMRLIGGPGREGGQERVADALHNLGCSLLLTVVAGALLADLVYSRRTAPASPRAKQGRRPEKEAADRRRRRRAGAAAEATQGGAQVGRNATIIGLAPSPPPAPPLSVAFDIALFIASSIASGLVHHLAPARHTNFAKAN